VMLFYSNQAMKVPADLQLLEKYQIRSWRIFLQRGIYSNKSYILRKTSALPKKEQYGFCWCFTVMKDGAMSMWLYRYWYAGWKKYHKCYQSVSENRPLKILTPWRKIHQNRSNIFLCALSIIFGNCALGVGVHGFLQYSSLSLHFLFLHSGLQ
jgi:hypothetical protein